MKEQLYECSKCGVVTDDRSHLCAPKSVTGLSDYCGSASDKSQMCDSIKESAQFTCVTCGRTAEKPDMICKTIKLH